MSYQSMGPEIFKKQRTSNEAFPPKEARDGASNVIPLFIVICFKPLFFFIAGNRKFDQPGD
jgi:hypothetical protein